MKSEVQCRQIFLMKHGDGRSRNSMRSQAVTMEKKIVIERIEVIACEVICVDEDIRFSWLRKERRVEMAITFTQEK